MIKVSIPTLKSIDIFNNVDWPNVYCLGLRNANCPHYEIVKSSIMCYIRGNCPDKGKWDYTFCVEIIHKQHHYSGDKLRFLRKYCIDMGYHNYILTNGCGAIFLQLANGNISYDDAIEAADKIKNDSNLYYHD